MSVVSELDNKIYKIIRESVSNFLREQAAVFDRPFATILDIAPQNHKGAAEYFHYAKILTADLNPGANPDYVIDITSNNEDVINSYTFDVVVCTEVLEHTLNPFCAVNEIYRVLKKGGVLLLTTPFNFRIHGPLPDCWRFTEYGLKEILNDFDSINIKAIEDDHRFLMPFHYTVVAIK